MGSLDTTLFDYVLVGAGLQNALLALAILDQRPDARVALLDREERIGGNHVWCFHEGDLPPSARDLIQPLIVARWPSYDVCFPDSQRTVDQTYAAITSERLDAVTRTAMGNAKSSALLLGRRATIVGSHAVVLDDGTALRGRLVVDARGPESLASEPSTAYQKFLGLELLLEVPGKFERPMLMDATVPQYDGFRFVYALPFHAQRILLEDTYFSDSPTLDKDILRQRLLDYAASHGLRIASILREESGVLPLPLDGMPAPAQRSPLVAGYAGGWFHPTTGYSFPVALRVALHLASSPDDPFGHAWSELTARHRRQTRFFLLLNRLLFRACDPKQRWRVLERFYSLPIATIARFYALETTTGDRARLLCGRPPRGVSIRLALTRGIAA